MAADLENLENVWRGFQSRNPGPAPSELRMSENSSKSIDSSPGLNTSKATKAFVEVGSW